MGHKFHKVYADHANTAQTTPTVIEDATNQSDPTIRSSRSRIVCRWLARHWFPLSGLLVNLITVAVLILTWVSYLRSNQLNLDSLTYSNTPWIDVHLDSVKYVPNHPDNPVMDNLPPNNGVLGWGSFKGPVFNSAVEVHFSLKNHSAVPAKRVYAGCFFLGAPDYSDTGFIGFGNVAIMPQQDAKMVARMLPMGMGAMTPQEAIDKIKQAKIGIEIYVFYFDALGHKTSFIETFHELGDTFEVTNTEFDPPESEIKHMIEGKDKPEEHWR